MAASIADHTSRDKWDILTNATTIKIGSTIITKNTNPDYGTFGNALVNGSNAITKSTRNALDVAAFPFRASNGSTLMSNLQGAQVGRFGVGSTVDSTVSNVTATIAPATNAIGNGISAVGTGIADAGKAVGNFADAASKEASGFIAPVTETLKKIDAIGKEFDKIIKDTFLGQVFKIKGSEILCAIFCIIISMLPCATRTALSKAIIDAKNAIKAVNSTVDGVNAMTLGAGVEIPAINNKSIADNVRNMFKGKIDNPDKTFNIPQDTRTKAPQVNLSVPPNVASVVANVTQVLSMLAKGKITVPVGINGNIWDIAQTILYCLQAQAVQMADEFLTKVVKKVETFLKGMMPQMCVGNLASIFINKITVAMLELKKYLLKQIKELFGASADFGIKWKTFGWELKGIMDLLAMLKALALVLKHFPDLALKCGVQPCNAPLPDSELYEIQEAVRNGMLVKETNMPANIAPADQTPTGKTLDELVVPFTAMAGKNLNIIESASGFDVIMPDLYKDAPSQIKNLILSPEFLTELGSAYTVYAPADLSFVNIVYSYKPVCS